MNRAFAAFTLGFALLFVSAHASADVVMPPPKTCPPGSEGKTGHVGPACVAQDCSTDTDCKGGKVCREQPLCTHVQKYGARHFPDKKFKRTVVTSSCTKAADCKAPDSCTTKKRCVSKATATASTAKPKPSAATSSAPSGSKSICAIAAPGSWHNATVAWWVLALVAIAVARRRPTA